MRWNVFIGALVALLCCLVVTGASGTNTFQGRSFTGFVKPGKTAVSSISSIEPTSGEKNLNNAKETGLAPSKSFNNSHSGIGTSSLDMAEQYYDFAVEAPGTWPGYTCGYGQPCDPGALNGENVYQVTIPTDGLWTLSLCNTSSPWNTYMYLGSASCLDDIGSNDNAYGELSMLNIFLSAGVYYLTIRGAGTECGDYQLDIYPSVIECPPGATSENEPDCYEGYIDATNGGCDSDPNVFGNVSCGETICGTTGTYLWGGNRRDTDWYTLTLNEPKTVTVTGRAVVPFQMDILGGTCPDAQIFAEGTALPCSMLTVSSALSAGTYWIWVAPSVFSDCPCGSPYYFTVTCSEAPSPPPNDYCWDVTPVPLVAGAPLQFTGDNTLATSDCPSLGIYPEVWIAFRTTEYLDIVLDYCGTSPVFSEAYPYLMDQCPCNSETARQGYIEWCGDGNYSISWPKVPPGDYWFPIRSQFGSVGPYIINVNGTPPQLPLPDPCEDAFFCNDTYDGNGIICQRSAIPNEPESWAVDDVFLSGNDTVTDLHWTCYTDESFDFQGTADLIVLTDVFGLPGDPIVVEYDLPCIRTKIYPDRNYYYYRLDVNYIFPLGRYWFGMRPVSQSAGGYNYWLTSAIQNPPLDYECYFRWPEQGYSDWTPGAVVLGESHNLAFCITADPSQLVPHGLIVTSGDFPIYDFWLREIMRSTISVKNSHSAILIFTECFGGDVYPRFHRRKNTAVLSATSSGEYAYYGFYHVGASEALIPSAGWTSDDVHQWGVARKCFRENPISNSQRYIAPLDPITQNSEIQSRHILVFAGKPHPFFDVGDRDRIRLNFGLEPRTKVRALGGDGSDKTWDGAATLPNLIHEMQQIGQEMNVNEQFILFVTDHGGYKLVDNHPEHTGNTYQTHYTPPVPPGGSPLLGRVIRQVEVDYFSPGSVQPGQVTVRLDSLPTQGGIFGQEVDLNGDHDLDDPFEGRYGQVFFSDVVIPPEGIYVSVSGGQFLHLEFISMGLGDEEKQCYNSCQYVPGDINGDGLTRGSDVTYGVRYFKGMGANPPDSCMVPSTGYWLFVAGDVNGDCQFRGADITRLVMYFKGYAQLSNCPETPPVEPLLRQDEEGVPEATPIK